jgi:hypothetical protein
VMLPSTRKYDPQRPSPNGQGRVLNDFDMQVSL